MVSAHSLRRGFVTSALEANAGEVIIMPQIVHASVDILREYYSEKRHHKYNHFI
jgi:integrase